MPLEELRREPSLTETANQSVTAIHAPAAIAAVEYNITWKGLDRFCRRAQSLRV